MSRTVTWLRVHVDKSVSGGIVKAHSYILCPYPQPTFAIHQQRIDPIRWDRRRIKWIVAVNLEVVPVESSQSVRCSDPHEAERVSDDTCGYIILPRIPPQADEVEDGEELLL